MKNVIYNYYNILVSDINKDDSNYFFYYNNELYLFYLVLNNINLVEEIYNYLNNNNIECFNIINNKDNSLFSKVDDKYYVLLNVKGILKYEYTFKDFKYYPVKGVGTDWGKLWGDRLDYYEIQIRELGFKYQTVLNSFGMFQGLAENAILYFNLTREKFKEDESIAIVHNRMKYPCYLMDYNNPVNYVVDYSVRDIAEYIKSYVISNDYDINVVINILDNLNTNNLMFNLLYSRLLYPTHYFDIFDDIILSDGVDDDIVDILNILNKYLDMLNKVYMNFNTKYDMFKIEWLDKIKT